MNKCTPQLHRFEYSETHDFNRPSGIGGNCRGFPYGHTCKCNTKVLEEPKLNTEIREGTMIHKIIGFRMESASNQLVESKGRLLTNCRTL